MEQPRRPVPPSSSCPEGNASRGRGGRGGGAPGGGRGGKGGGKASGGAGGIAKQLASLDDRSIEHESNIEILRAQRAAARQGKKVWQDEVRENEGVDEDDPLLQFDDGIRIEPFNMRREMAEGHFDEGGFYILNKDDEKQVTDAWLDTIDKAQRTATFRQMERQKKATELARERLSALTQSLGKDEDEEDDKEEDGAGKAETGDDDDVKPQKAARPAAVDKVAEQAAEEAIDSEEATDVITMMEALIGELDPLETPAEALRRWRKASSCSASEALRRWRKASSCSASEALRAPSDADVGLPLKMRARIRQRRVEAAAAAASATEAAVSTPATAASASTAGGAAKRRLSEWGDYEAPPVTSKIARTVAAEAIAGEGASGAHSVSGADADGGGEEAVCGEEVPPAGEALAPRGTAAAAGMVADVAALAAAAAKAEAEAKARNEATEAQAVAHRASRVVLYADLDAKGNPEFDAIVNLNDDDQKELKVKEDVEVPSGNGVAGKSFLNPSSRKRPLQVDDLAVKRRAKIERLTDLCDRLLERGVLVYDSTRELLAIEVRERRGDNLELPPEDSSACVDSSGATAGDAKPTESTKAAAVAEQRQEILYVNSRLQRSSGEDAPSSGLLGLLENKEVGVEASDAQQGDSPQLLLWQLRWTGTPSEVHGPFDSVTMQGWFSQGCFSEERPAEVRQCDAHNEPREPCWHRWDKVDFSLYL